MSQTTIIVIAVIVAIALLVLLYLVRGRKQHVGFGEAAPLPRAASAPELPSEPSPPLARTSAPALAPEGHGVGSEVTAAIEDVIDQFVGLDAHPSGRQAPAHAGDTLTMLKGLGPRVATRLADLGVTRFDQIAAWDDSDVAAIDAQMGTFKGRIVRDRWVEQARLLARGDQQSFEAQFGKLGG